MDLIREFNNYCLGAMLTTHHRMIAAIAGPLGRNLSQGQVSGALGEMGLKSSEVYKLA